VSCALETIEREHLEHYGRIGRVTLKDRLRTLYRLVLMSVRAGDPDPMRTHFEPIARTRSLSWFPVEEVLIVITALSRATWARVESVSPPQDKHRALTLLHEIFQAAAVTLARTYLRQSEDLEVPLSVSEMTALAGIPF
jgi:hypothetical protein